MNSDYKKLDQIFHPRSIAIIGASNRPGNAAVVFLKAHAVLNFAGPLYAIAPNGDQVPDFPTFKNVNHVPGPVDHAVIAVPAAYLLEVLSDCVRKKVNSVVIFTSGFSESGDPEGMEKERLIRAKARESGIRMIGPNCMGIYYPHNGMSFRPDLPPVEGPGEISYLSQSGGMAFGAVFLGNRFGLKYNKVVSFGNEVDLGGPELLDYFAEDPETKVILAYLEGTRDGRSLGRALIRAGARKPLVVLKGGLTETGVRAAASHTGALGGSRATWESVFRQAGAIQVDTVDELVGAALVLRRLPKFTGRKMVIITISGGLSVNFTDRAGFWGFEVPELAAETCQKLKRSFDIPGTSVKNPIDMAAAFMMFPIYPDVFRALDEDPETDLIFLVISIEFLAYIESFMPGITDNSMNAFLGAIKEVKKPLVVVLPSVIGEELRLRAEQLFVKAGFAVFESVDRAMKVLNLVRRYHQRSKRKE
ncbi:MAG: CoA-binding protein [bacterium]|nr:CoA-binding protein [bacterium]